MYAQFVDIISSGVLLAITSFVQAVEQSLITMTLWWVTKNYGGIGLLLVGSGIAG